MPDSKPPVYNWTVSVSGSTSFTVEAAYPVIDDKGHMLLKDAEHKIVFAAAPETGCTFTRAGLASPTVTVDAGGSSVMSDDDIAKLTETIGRSIKLSTVSGDEVRKMRHGLRPRDDGDETGVRGA